MRAAQQYEFLSHKKRFERFPEPVLRGPALAAE